MFADESAHLPISDVHRAALNWFETNRGAVRAWHEIAKQGDSGNRLASLAKRIYKPAYTEYALSIRQTLTSPYSDKEIVYRPDGSWLYPYFQENSEPSLRDKEATNRGLMKCLHDGVPIGVLIQTKPKPGVEYLVLGLGRVVEWTAGYFIIERYHQSVSIAPIENAARDWVSADLKPIPPSPQQNVREWECD